MDGCKFIDKIGIELEAAWRQPKKGLVIDESFSPADFSPEFRGVGELVSHPIASKDEMLNWLNDNWPDETCPKCAMHVHFSLNHLNYYSACMSTRFYEHFLNEMAKWGKDYNCRNELFWQRLNGENRYCRKRFNPDVQVKYKEKGHNRQDRRDHWNFCYGLHKTMECRLLPMFKNIDTAKSAIFALINCIENYLSQYVQEEKHVVDELFDFDCVPEKEEIYTDEHEKRYQELANTLGISPEQRRDLEKLMAMRRNQRGRKQEKSKFKFNYFQVYNPQVNASNVQLRPKINVVSSVRGERILKNIKAIQEEKKTGISFYKGSLVSSDVMNKFAHTDDMILDARKNDEKKVNTDKDGCKYNSDDMITIPPPANHQTFYYTEPTPAIYSGIEIPKYSSMKMPKNGNFYKINTDTKVDNGGEKLD